MVVMEWQVTFGPCYMDQMLSFLLMADDSTDMKSLFLMTTMMQNNCEDTNM